MEGLGKELQSTKKKNGKTLSSEKPNRRSMNTPRSVTKKTTTDLNLGHRHCHDAQQMEKSPFVN